VVEANPLAIPLLAEIRDDNQCKFEILNRAIAYEKPSVTFRPNFNLCANSLQQKGQKEEWVTVAATTLRDIVDERKFDSFSLIGDIEGYEFDVVLNDAEVLRKASTIILETHARFIGEAKTAQLLTRLEDLGFKVVDQEASVVVLKQSHVSNLQGDSGVEESSAPVDLH
jgi:FkbM family methyltransferase